MATQGISSSGTITFSGLATGIDTSSIVEQLMSLERAPQNILVNQKTVLEGKVEQYNKLSTLLKSFQSLMAGMNTSSTFSAKTVAVADSSVATATATGAAFAGNHILRVTSLASSQTLVSQSSTNSGYASDTESNFGTGTITISDTTGGADDVVITIDSTNNSLQGIANAINESDANVTASVVNDGSGTPYRLAIMGKDTNTYSLTAGLTGGTYDTPTFEEKIAASQAVFQLDGIDMTRTTNTVANAIPGVTLTLQGTNASSQTLVTIGNDTSAVTSKINEFIDKYNEVMELINENTSYDASTGEAGTLFGDATIRTVLDTLRDLLTTQVAGTDGSYASLAEIGISSDAKTGLISVDSSILSNALSNDFNGVVSLFTRNTGTYGLDLNQYGIAEQFNKQIDALTHYYSGASNSGIVSTRIHGLNDNISDIEDRIAAMEVRLIAMEKRMNEQFTALEQLISNTTAWGNQLLAALGVDTSSD